jgi:hypothetical protein
VLDLEIATMFTLRIPLTLAAVDSIKADLRQACPDVKSSHRAEAVARGLGFRTNAALLAALRAPNSAMGMADGGAFTAYLAEHAFEVPPIEFYRAIGRSAMRAVLDREERLTWSGIGVGRPDRKSDGQWETIFEHHDRFLARRAEILDHRVIEEFLLALAFLAKVKTTKTVRPDTDSYRLKHIAENYSCNYAEGEPLGPSYVSNGALIAAAIHLGFRYRKYLDDLGYDYPNVTFSLSQRCLDDLDCEIRPNGARAQDRARRAEERRSGGPFGRWVAA